LRLFALDGQHLASYYKGMSNTPDYTSDLPDNFDEQWDEQIECDEYYYEASDADWWESAYGPADDGGYSF